jgi:hypothetical protein
VDEHRPVHRPVSWSASPGTPGRAVLALLIKGDQEACLKLRCRPQIHRSD